MSPFPPDRRPWPLAAALCALALAGAARAQDDPLDRLDDALTFGAWDDALRARLSGTLDLEGYYLRQPAPGPHLLGGKRRSSTRG